MKQCEYIIITPAKDEESHIEKTIISVINQSVLPLKWIIVDDNSKDDTARIVGKYLDKYTFIELVKNESEEKRNFGNKVFAIRNGFESVAHLNYNYYCNLDADVSFEPHYFEILLSKFKKNPNLGICGGKLFDLVDDRFIEQRYELHSVAGPVQFFRKECYESFGGYQPFKSGFIDGFAEISARKNGWDTRTFPELKVKHYRPAGTAKGSKIKVRYEGGKLEYRFGYSYFYHFMRTLTTIKQGPFLFGALACMFGFVSCLIRNEKRLVEKDFIKYVRGEQRERIVESISTFFKPKDL